jgi:D-alanyl-D-alanine carboxypeptidase/D-alanyl-D-alanine-endopeptidase (penicillin-binding protein 4)
MKFPKRSLVILLIIVAGCVKPVPQISPVPPATRDSHSELRFQLEQIFASPEFCNAFWGVAIQSLDTGEMFYEQNSEKLLMPASNMKILTAIAALKILGPEFTYDTHLKTDGEIRKGKLNGNLIVIGNGDPTISVSDLNDWAAQLKQSGITEVAGSIVGDDSAFDDERIGSGWSWDELPYYYATETSGLQLAENAITITVTAGEPGGPITVRKEPDTSYIQVIQKVQIVRDAQTSVKWSYKPETKTVYVSGILPPGGQDYGGFAISNPGAYFACSLKEALQRNGIHVEGDAYRAADRHYEVPEMLHVLLSRKSPPLREMLGVLLKESQNLYAETFVKTLGNGNTADGIQSISATLIQMGISPQAFVIVDGSGLSRYNYVTPQALLMALSKIYNDDLHHVFYNALPIAGIDGTLKSRLKGTAAENNARAKTGSISNVRSLSGFVRTRDGEMVVFALLINNFNASPESATRIQDQVVELLAAFHH